MNFQSLKKPVIGVLFTLVVSGMSLPAEAGRFRNEGAGEEESDRIGQRQGGQPPRNTPGGTEQAQLRDAEAQVRQIEKDIAGIKSRVEKTFPGKDEYAKARARVQKAISTRDAAIRKAKAKLMASPEYKAVVEKREKAVAQNEELGGRNASQEEINAIAQQIVDTGLTIRKMESEAVDSDMDVINAKQEVVTAQQALAALDGQLKVSLDADPEYVAANQQLTEAKEKVKSAREQLANARKAAQQNRPRPAPRPSSGSGGGRAR